MRKQGGVNKFEFSLALAVIGFVAVFLLRVLEEAQEFGEKSSVEATIRNIDSGLRWAMAERIARGREANLAELAEHNPLAWLERPPEGYLGEFAVAPALPPGGWYYDGSRKELVYRPRLDRHLLRSEPSGVLRWRVEVSGRWPSGEVAAVRMGQITSFRWF